jgi:hypothetical protein
LGSTLRVEVLPPTPLLFSNTVASMSFSARWFAQLSPAIPAPMIATFGFNGAIAALDELL